MISWSLYGPTGWMSPTPAVDKCSSTTSICNEVMMDVRRCWEMFSSLITCGTTSLYAIHHCHFSLKHPYVIREIEYSPPLQSSCFKYHREVTGWLLKTKSLQEAPLKKIFLTRGYVFTHFRERKGEIRERNSDRVLSCAS